MKKTNERDWVSEVGAPAYASIAEMVAALQCDRRRLDELRDDRELFHLATWHQIPHVVPGLDRNLRLAPKGHRDFRQPTSFGVQ